MNTSIPTPEENREGSDVGGVPLITMVDLNSLTLPLFESDDGLKANPLYQMDKLTPSAPILISQSSASIPIPAKISAALVITARNYWGTKRVDELPENSEQRHTAENVPSRAVQSTKLDFIALTRHILFATTWKATTGVEPITMVHHCVQSGPANILS